MHQASWGAKWEFPKIRGTVLEDPQNKDYSILGSILGSPYFGKLPNTSGIGSPGQIQDLGTASVFPASLAC